MAWKYLTFLWVTQINALVTKDFQKYNVKSESINSNELVAIPQMDFLQCAHFCMKEEEQCAAFFITDEGSCRKVNLDDRYKKGFKSDPESVVLYSTKKLTIFGKFLIHF